MFSKDLEQTIGQCYKRAREARHEFMTVEHLLLALLDNPSAQAVLRACGADFERLRVDLEQAIEASVSRLADDDGRDTQPTLGFQRVLQRAVYHVQSSGKKEVTGANVLVAIFGEKDSHAVYFLTQQDVTRLDVVNYLSHGIAKLGDEPEPGAASPDGEGRAEGGEGEGKTDVLTEYATNLNEQARAGKIDPLVGRADEIERTIQVLCRRRKNNPLYVPRGCTARPGWACARRRTRPGSARTPRPSTPSRSRGNGTGCRGGRTPPPHRGGPPRRGTRRCRRRPSSA